MPSLISELITCMVSSQREQPRPERPGLGDCNRRQEQLWFLWLGETVQESNFKSSVLDSVRVDNKREILSETALLKQKICSWWELGKCGMGALH